MAQRKINYREYIASEAWKSKRRALKKHLGAQFRCFGCGCSPPLNVHHATYERLGSEKLSDLMPLCRYCHRLLHERLEHQFPGMPLRQKVHHTRNVFLDLFGHEAPRVKEPNRGAKKRRKRRQGKRLSGSIAQRQGMSRRKRYRQQLDARLNAVDSYAKTVRRDRSLAKEARKAKHTEAYRISRLPTFEERVRERIRLRKEAEQRQLAAQELPGPRSPVTA